LVRLAAILRVFFVGLFVVRLIIRLFVVRVIAWIAVKAKFGSGLGTELGSGLSFELESL
jgi:hypothetical protein